MDERVRGALGDKYDPRARYSVVTADMAALPKFAADEAVGELTESDGSKMVVLRKAPPVVPPPPSRPLRAAPQPPTERSLLDRIRGTRE